MHRVLDSGRCSRPENADHKCDGKWRMLGVMPEEASLRLSFE